MVLEISENGCDDHGAMFLQRGSNHHHMRIDRMGGIPHNHVGWPDHPKHLGAEKGGRVNLTNDWWFRSIDHHRIYLKSYVDHGLALSNDSPLWFLHILTMIWMNHNSPPQKIRPFWDRSPCPINPSVLVRGGTIPSRHSTSRVQIRLSEHRL